MGMAVDAQHHDRRSNRREIDPVSLAVLVVAIVSIALGLIGIAQRGTTPVVLIPGVLAAIVAALTLYRHPGR